MTYAETEAKTETPCSAPAGQPLHPETAEVLEVEDELLWKVQRKLLDVEQTLMRRRRRGVDLGALIVTLAMLGKQMSQAVDELKAAVAAEKTVTASVITLLTDLARLLSEAASNSDLVEVQRLADELEANTSVLAAAVTAGTPTPQPPPAPPNP